MNINYTSKIWGECILWTVGKYPDGSAALRIVDANTGEVICTLTVNVGLGNLKPDLYAIKTWSENAETAAELLELGFFKNTGSYVRAGFVNAQIWKLMEHETQRSLQF